MLVSYSMLIVNNAILQSKFQQIINTILYNRLMMKIFFLVALTIFGSLAAVREDLMTKVPGYGDDFNTSIYSGYLNTSSPTRRLHYVFVQGAKGANNSMPLTLWLNGGPGCSSLLGFLQEIGPYYLEQGKNYTAGDKLEKNPYSWHLASNLLFLQSPAGVGYSINTNQTFRYDDLSTMQDNFQALKNFFSLYPQYKKAEFWISGQSYAGKYIPDLAFRIDHYNLDPSTPSASKIKLTGLFIGNGVIDFRDDVLFKSTVQYFIGHDFVDPDTLTYWNGACQHDQQSAGCQFFMTRFEETLDDVNPYNIYSYCYYNDSFAIENKTQQKRQFLSQQSILMSLAKQDKYKQQRNGNGQRSKFNGAPCAYFDGLYQYFNTHYKQYHAEARASQKLKWNGPCAEDISAKYLIDRSGSTYQLSYLFTRLDDLHIVLYNGDWDAVVPFVDTIKNLQRMKLLDPSLYAPIFYKDQHIGFHTIMAGISFVTVKGASHQVPQSKRPESYYIFQTLLTSFNRQKNQTLKFN